MVEAQQKIAAESLRKRLKAQLRPDLSPDGLHQIQLAQRDLTGRHRVVRGKDRSTKGVGEMPSPGVRRVSTKWNDKNPFRPFVFPEGQHEDSKQAGQHSPTMPDKANISEPWNAHSHPYRHSVPSLAPTVSESQEGNGSRSTTTTNSWNYGNEFCSMPIVVVANADCELSHPRPSRSSEKHLMKALVKEKGHEDEGGQVAADATQRKERVSQSSTASFHTARRGGSSE